MIKWLPHSLNHSRTSVHSWSVFRAWVHVVAVRFSIFPVIRKQSIRYMYASVYLNVLPILYVKNKHFISYKFCSYKFYLIIFIKKNFMLKIQIFYQFCFLLFVGLRCFRMFLRLYFKYLFDSKSGWLFVSWSILHFLFTF